MGIQLLIIGVHLARSTRGRPGAPPRRPLSHAFFIDQFLESLHG